MKFKKMHNFTEDSPPPREFVQCCVIPPSGGASRFMRKDTWMAYNKRVRPHMDPERCQRGASVTVNGKPYCRPHAAAIALKETLK